MLTQTTATLLKPVPYQFLQDGLPPIFVQPVPNLFANNVILLKGQSAPFVSQTPTLISMGPPAFVTPITLK